MEAALPGIVHREVEPEVFRVGRAQRVRGGNSRSVLSVRGRIGEAHLTSALCVPSTLELAGDPPAPIDPMAFGLDHFLCYSISNDQEFSPFTPFDVALSDRFEDSIRLVKKPKTLCTPVDKNGEGIINTETHLTCYQIGESPAGLPLNDLKIDAVVNNQLAEDRTLEIKKPRTICLPSEKEHID